MAFDVDSATHYIVILSHTGLFNLFTDGEYRHSLTDKQSEESKVKVWWNENKKNS